jgi:hypothetical protein
VSASVSLFTMSVRNVTHEVTSQDVRTAVFGESTDAQLRLCFGVASNFFSRPLSASDYILRESFLNQQPLTSNKGWRTWCLTLPAYPDDILATCKTIKRDIVVRDSNGIREAQGYCIAAVATHPRFHGRGLASLMLSNIAQWVDGPGNAEATMLYSDVGEVL